MADRFSKYFGLEEFLTSSVARQLSIENTPSFEIVQNLKKLAEFLDGAREAWGSGIRVSSGYRCPELNKAVGGVPNSVHTIGFAADLQPINGNFEGFKKFFVSYLKDKTFDELIIETSGKTTWLHFQLYSPKGFQRKKVFSLAV